ncbi:MAG: hypothetical protein AAFQ83_11925 [Bacteroidota bacterium]
MLTILLGLFAYQVNNLLSYYLDAPTLVYDYGDPIDVPTDSGVMRTLNIELMNITNDQLFEEVKIDIRYRSKVDTIKGEKHVFYTPYIRSESPSPILGDRFKDISRKNPYRWGELISFRFPMIHPQSKYFMEVKTLCDPAPREMPRLYLKVNTPILLKEKSCSTRLALNRTGINFFFLGLWAVLILGYIYRLAKNPPEETPKDNNSNKDSNAYYPW